MTNQWKTNIMRQLKNLSTICNMARFLVPLVHTRVSEKRIPDIISYNLNTDRQILTILGTNISETAEHQMTVQGLFFQVAQKQTLGKYMLNHSLGWLS